MNLHELEYGNTLHLDFKKLQQVADCGDMVPVVVQHADTGEVLILAYTNQDAFEQTQRQRIAIFWSTSRNALWIKGATSGDYLDLVDIAVNCEQNALLYRVRPRTGGVCHTQDAAGHAQPTCFYRLVETHGGVETHNHASLRMRYHRDA